MALAPIGLQHFLVLSAILFAIGMFGALSRSNAVGVLLSIELMLNAVNIMMVAFACYVAAGRRRSRLWPASCSRSSS